MTGIIAIVLAEKLVVEALPEKLKFVPNKLVVVALVAVRLVELTVVAVRVVPVALVNLRNVEVV